MKMTTNRACIALVAVLVGVGLAACEKKGPLEQMGEEVDEAVSTLKNDGKEPVSAKLDDAVDDVRKEVEKAAR